MNLIKAYNSVVIHQPHFFAWLPYYCRIACAENFVILDNVNFRRHFYHDRTYILDSKHNLIQISIPNNGSQNLQLKDVKIFDPKYHIGKILKSIHLNYKKYKYFDEIYEYIETERINLESESSLVLL